MCVLEQCGAARSKRWERLKTAAAAVPASVLAPAPGEGRGVHWGKPEQRQEQFLLLIFLKKTKHQTNVGFVYYFTLDLKHIFAHKKKYKNN